MVLVQVAGRCKDETLAGLTAQTTANELSTQDTSGAPALTAEVDGSACVGCWRVHPGTVLRVTQDGHHVSRRDGSGSAGWAYGPGH
jgi:hypothetical protein